MRLHKLSSMILAAAVACYAVVAQADVFNMGSGLTSLETAQVGNPGNAADLAGYGAVNFAFNIGKYEVTAGQYADFLNNVAVTDTYGLYNDSMRSDGEGCNIQQTGSSGSYAYSVAADYANRPVNYVSFWDAARFANWLHNGQGPGDTETGAYTLTPAGMAANTITKNAFAQWWVPSENEWYKAAYHDKAAGLAATYFKYPTSNNLAPGQDMTDVTGNNANHYTTPYAIPIDSGKYTTLVGEFQNSDSPYGTFDQGGNVWEWNESIPSISSRGSRGGSFNYQAYSLDSSNYLQLNPTYESSKFGFRVASVPEPGSPLMTAMAVAMGLICCLRKSRGNMVRFASVLIGTLLFIAFGLFSFPSVAVAELVIDDAVFAHDFEVLVGDTVVPLRGPNATKTPNILVNSSGTVGFGSAQHLLAPSGSDYAAIDTGSRLSSSASQLSFSIFFNGRGDNGNDDDSFELARLLSSYNGAGVPSNESAFGLISYSGRRLTFSAESSSTNSTAALPFSDALWHQAGIVFDGGLLTFYFDGASLGSTINVGYSSIAAHSFNWFLVEDAGSASVPSEYFDGGDYDEAALWLRALSPTEMSALYANGLNAATVPEPASLWMLAIGCATLSLFRLRKRHSK